MAGHDQPPPPPEASLLEQAADLLRNVDALAPLLPHVLRLVALWPRFIAIARKAVADQGEGVGLTDRLAPLSDELFEEATAAGKTLLEHDDLIVGAVEQLAAALRDASARPGVAAALDRLRQRTLDTSDAFLARLVDHALDTHDQGRVVEVVHVVEAMLENVVKRTLDLALDQGVTPRREPDRRD